MAELVTFKIEKGFLEEIDAVAKKENYASRTEFIKNALRKNIDEIKLKQAMLEIGKMKGKAKKRFSDKELHKSREKLFAELEKEFGIR